MALFFCYYCLCYLQHKSSFPRCMLRTSTVAQEINYMLSPWCFKLLLQNRVFWILDGWIIWRLSQWLVKEGPAHCMRLGHWKNSWLTDTHHEVRRVMKKTLTFSVEKSAIVNDDSSECNEPLDQSKKKKSLKTTLVKAGKMQDVFPARKVVSPFCSACGASCKSSSSVRNLHFQALGVNTSISAGAHAGNVPFSRWQRRWSLLSSCRIFLQTFLCRFPNSSQLPQPQLVYLEVTAPCHSLSGTVGHTGNVGLVPWVP